MSRSLHRIVVALTIAAAGAILVTPSVAEACGGFFCSNPPSPDVPAKPIYQAGERVVFAYGEQNVTMHVEVRYQGPSENFAWLLPIASLPTDAAGNPLPVEEMLDVSSTMLFDQLQARTDPAFDIEYFGEQQACSEGLALDGPSVRGTTNFDPDADGTDAGSVQVIDTGAVGPYEATLLEANDVDVLYDWLAENGYLQDPNARPILQGYVTQNFKFLGLRLRKDRDVGDLRPIELQVGETNACVPLRITQIAAVDDMPILVWVLGDNRAIPKNFLHAKVNPQALIWPGAPNYVRVVTEAIDEIAGRAWVTEYATSDQVMAGVLDNSDLDDLLGFVDQANDLSSMATVLAAYLPYADPDLLSVMRAHIPMPEGVTGYPGGSCDTMPNDLGQPRTGVCENDAIHQTTEQEFYGYLDQYIGRVNPGSVDLQTLKTDLVESYAEPRRRAQKMLDAARWTTRFFTTMSSHEMQRDPIFAFNAELERVEPWPSAEATVRNGTGLQCSDWYVDVRYPNGSEYTFSCLEERCGGTDDLKIEPVPDAPALLEVEIVDEGGQPRPFDPKQAPEIDQMLDMAEPGRPSLPNSFALLPPPNRAQAAPQPTNRLGGPLVCTLAGTRGETEAPLGALLALGALGLVAIRRTRR